MLPTGVLFLAAFINNTLFIQVDLNVKESFICLSNDTKNDTWPSAWKRLDYGSNGLYFHKFEENNNSSSIYYKLRFYFVDRNYQETKDWNLLYAKPCKCNSIKCIIFLVIGVILMVCVVGYILLNVLYKYVYQI